MKSKPTSMQVHDAVLVLFEDPHMMVNGLHCKIIENRHVLLGNVICHRLIIEAGGVQTRFDIPIETNKPAQTELPL